METCYSKWSSPPNKLKTQFGQVIFEQLQDFCIAGVRIEWCKARARAARRSEEVDLLLEEMRRVLGYLEWEIGAWRSRVTMRQLNKVPEQELKAHSVKRVCLLI
ncbi:hypothetical protein BDR04DRAFT_1233833 [Suillus decipiens]|nr:hypothetical protein BDR04DRAFT_1233833 [Suillus decipiens]